MNPPKTPGHYVEVSKETYDHLILARDAALRRAEMAEEVAETVAAAARLFKQAALFSLDRATQAEQRERIAADGYNGQQQSYRELETLYQASQERANEAFELLGQVLYFLQTYHNQPIGAQNQQAAKLCAKIKRLAGLK